jgi:hypothetical protein
VLLLAGRFHPDQRPPSIGGPARVLVGKTDGWLRQIVHNGITTTFDPNASIPLPGLPPSGIPVECFPARPTMTLPVRTGTDYLTLARYPQTDGFVEEAARRFEGRTKIFNRVVVRQRYLSGEKWWFRFERFLYGVKDLEAQVTSPPSTTPAPPSGYPHPNHRRQTRCRSTSACRSRSTWTCTIGRFRTCSMRSVLRPR